MNKLCFVYVAQLAPLLGFLVAGCTADPSAHLAQGCASDADCEGGRCYRGFCLREPAMDGGPCGAEVACNGEDDDCDERVDEMAEPSCDTGLVGACGDGEWVCSEGAPRCVRSTVPSPETCDGRDEDCDATVDEGPPQPCYPDEAVGCVLSDGVWTCNGTCDTGVAACVGGARAACEGARLPGEEACGGSPAVDEDCDGSIDEGCACSADQVCYGGAAGTAGVGVCHFGLQACADGALDPACADQVVPTAETCLNPGADDDCDGAADDVPGLGDPCEEAGAIGDCRLGTRVCEVGTAAPQCAARAPVEETCDGNDEDCDGRVDESIDLSTDNSNCGACGNACGAEETCCAGICVDPRASAAHCGACAAEGGVACEASEVCCNGTCEDAASCGTCMEDCAAEGRTCCVGVCADTANDERNCGGCGVACAAGQLCCDGACVGSDEDHCGQGCDTCEEGGELCCSGACVPIGNDHCNACGVACATGDCCDSGCVDLLRDPTSCGACGNACPGGQGCSQGHCCPTGQTWCESLGGCRDLATDESACGTCNTTCGGGSACCGGACRLLGLGCSA